MNDRITRVQFQNFKAFSDYSVSLDDVNILIGPNNSGKSTIISTFRLLNIGIRKAYSSKAERMSLSGRIFPGLIIESDAASISIENVTTDYNNMEARVTFQIGKEKRLELIFPDNETTIFTWHCFDRVINTPKLFRENFAMTIQVVPVLGPLEHNEEVLTRETVKSKMNSHRASRHFRNYWRFFPEEWEDFKASVEVTWPGMTISPPEPDGNHLMMFCKEGRIDREIFWSGFGFQIWCQLLTHLSRAKFSDLVVIDEPEIYLHPEVQRQLMGILRDLGCMVVIATHSVEIISEADPSEILLVDKTRPSAVRLRDVESLQGAIDYIGSAHNIRLAQLARTGRLLFVEALSDFKVFQRISKRLGHDNTRILERLTAFESGGFQSWREIKSFAWGIKKTVGKKLSIAALYDRDFFCDEEIAEISNELASQGVSVHFHGCKEIENYLIDPETIWNCVRKSNPAVGLLKIKTLVFEEVEGLKAESMGQYSAKYVEYHRKFGLDVATLNTNCYREFEKNWKDERSRLRVVSGKSVLSAVRKKIQDIYSYTLTDLRLVEAIPIEKLRTETSGFVDFVRMFAEQSLSGG